MKPLCILVLLCASLSCSDTPDSGEPLASPWSSTGPHSAGTTSVVLPVEGRSDPVPVRLWYPSAEPQTTVSLASLVEDIDQAAVLEDLISAAPEGCPSPAVEAAVEGAPLPQQAPVLVMSHCHDCLGLSGATMAATLARHGYIVVAPDHVGNTLFDLLDENGGSLDEPTLAQRARDSSAALSAVLDGTALPAGLSADPDQVGALGHSFGAVTVGRLIRDDPRVQAGFTVGAPLDNPLLVGVNAGDVTVPVLQLVLEEDHSIGTLGNDLMRSNHLELQGEAWLVSMPDAGHWSVSDLCGVIDAFKPGCGDDTRMQGGATFSYIAADAARRTAGVVGAAFFDHALRGDAQATAWLDEPETEAPVSSEAR